MRQEPVLQALSAALVVVVVVVVFVAFDGVLSQKEEEEGVCVGWEQHSCC